MTDGSSNIVLDPNMPAITPQTGVFHTATVEPTTTSLYRKLGVHESGAGVWVPQGPVPKLLIPPGTRLGLVLLSTATISFTIGLVLEE